MEDVPPQLFFVFQADLADLFLIILISFFLKKMGKKKKEKEKQNCDTKYENKHNKYNNLFMWLCP